VNTVQVHNWRNTAKERFTYEEFMAAQLEMVRNRLNGTREHDAIILTTHPPTITLGRRSLKEQLSHIRVFSQTILESQLPDDELLRRARAYLQESCDIDLIKTNRGGSVWYHDHGVLQIYLIFQVPPFMMSGIIYPLEEALLRTLNGLNIKTERAPESIRKEDKSFLGLWVKERKIAALGMRIQSNGTNYVSMFGASLNVTPDMSGCEMIDPCGIPDRHMTSIAEEYGYAKGMEIPLIPCLLVHLAHTFNIHIAPAT